MTSNITLSGGPLAGAVIPTEDAQADNNGVPGTTLTLTIEDVVVNDDGDKVIVEVPVVYRVAELTTRKISGMKQSYGTAVFVSVG